MIPTKTSPRITLSTEKKSDGSWKAWIKKKKETQLPKFAVSGKG